MLDAIKLHQQALIDAQALFATQRKQFIADCKSKFTTGMQSKQVVDVLSELKLVDNENLNYERFKNWVICKMFKWETPLDQDSLNYFRDQLEKYIINDVLNETPLPGDDDQD